MPQLQYMVRRHLCASLSMNTIWVDSSACLRGFLALSLPLPSLLSLSQSLSSLSLLSLCSRNVQHTQLSATQHFSHPQGPLREGHRVTVKGSSVWSCVCVCMCKVLFKTLSLWMRNGGEGSIGPSVLHPLNHVSAISTALLQSVPKPRSQ